jgi:hypothetical protein
VISPSQRPLPTQDNTTNIHAPSGITTRDPSNQAALDRAATGIVFTVRYKTKSFVVTETTGNDRRPQKYLNTKLETWKRKTKDELRGECNGRYMWSTKEERTVRKTCGKYKQGRKTG